MEVAGEVMGLVTALLGLGGAVVLLVGVVTRFLRWRTGKMLRHLPESMKEGSALVTVALAQFPYVVGIYAVKKIRPDKKEFKGTGIILEGYVLTANHVVDDVKPALDEPDNLSKYNIYARTFDGQFHLLGDWIQLHTDAIAFKAPQGYKSGRVETLSRPQHAQIIAAREQSNASMGIIRNKPEIAYGFVEYDGSTIAGFSGAPYTNGQKVLGMHLQGGSGGNFGYSASFLTTRLRRMVKPESSEWEAFERALAQAAHEDIEWERGLDETEVRVGGRYFLFDNEEFDVYIEESEFMDWFYEDYEDNQGKKHRFKKSVRSSKREEHLEEPDYEGGDNSFLEVPAQPDSAGQDLKKDIDSLHITMKSIQNSVILMQKDLVGLQEACENLNKAFICTQKLERELKELREVQLPRSLSGLEHNLTELIKLRSDVRPDSTSPSGTSVSEQPSEPLTQPAAPDLANSQNTPQSATRWDGMESDFEKFRTWRNSVKAYDPEYVEWRDLFLKSLGLEPWQSKILIGRLKNILNKRKGRLAQKNYQTGSNSS